MKNFTKHDNASSLKLYATPNIDTEFVCLEHSIAAGSAIVTPLDENSEVLHEWETGTDVSGDLLW
ncbi:MULTISPECIES: hypothetical protein [Sphingobacterium]|uniref:Uncharacterized protein n=1 Tax=Sphingobacterium populi TaxID=1812824 RepID=A0ABW5U9J5_9SPHI|nr:hypothetical protein [Sphingobacterium sp. CFCC 11742]